ncbi:MAG: hypothetical protein IJL14_11400 [Selenomonadaceae bacterium]|nr:hypothetical protein [Selenomonadaceae bacterium]
MTDQERINENLQRQIDAQNARIDNVMMKVDVFIAESQQQREDMRRLWERQDAMQAKHDAEMKELQKRQDEIQAKQDAKMHEMNQRFYEKVDANAKEFTKQLHSNFVQTMIGVGAIMAAIGGLIITVLR